jgi:hypothetical protein
MKFATFMMFLNICVLGLCLYSEYERGQYQRENYEKMWTTYCSLEKKMKEISSIQKDTYEKVDKIEYEAYYLHRYLELFYEQWYKTITNDNKGS